jgi:hypothetical protein
MTPPMLHSRNEVVGFAERTRKNLLALEAAAANGDDVHLVTQIVTSLLGLVAYPWEKKVSHAIAGAPLDELFRNGWPQWTFTSGQCDRLGDLAKHLRNAIAHGRFSFSSESRVPADVTIDLEDWKHNASSAHWRGSIRADLLRDFCLRFIALINQAQRPSSMT